MSIMGWFLVAVIIALTMAVYWVLLRVVSPLIAMGNPVRSLMTEADRRLVSTVQWAFPVVPFVVAVVSILLVAWTF